MSACRRGCQTNLVALALYRSECQFRTLARRAWPSTRAAAALGRHDCPVTGSDESAGKSSGGGRQPRGRPARRPAPPPSRRCRCTGPGRGTRSRMPGRVAALLRQRPQPRVGGHAAADDQVVDAVRPAGVDRLAGQHVGHRLLEGGRDVGHRDRLARPPPGPRPSGPPRSSARRRRSRWCRRGTCRGGTRSRPGPRPPPPGRCAGRRGTAARAPGPPCRRPRPPRRRSSRRAARPRSARSGTSSREECPPDTSSAMAGAGSGPCSSWSTATCAARWLTPYSGLPRASA